MKSDVSLKGEVTCYIEKNNSTEIVKFKNNVLKTGKTALAKVLAGEDNDNNFRISKMIFGDSGTSNGTPKYVQDERTGLFGSIKASKGVSTMTNGLIPGHVQVICVLRGEDAVDISLNEMALVMSNGDIYSMATFLDVNKTSEMQLTWVWDVYLL